MMFILQLESALRGTSQGQPTTVKGDAKNPHLFFHWPAQCKKSNLILKARGQRTRIAFCDSTQSDGEKHHLANVIPS